MQRQIRNLEERNRRVELDKAWETSKSRRAIISALTYLIIVAFLIAIDAPNPWLNALVPVAGFILSTLTLGFFKKIWIRYN